MEICSLTVTSVFSQVSPNLQRVNTLETAVVESETESEIGVFKEAT